MPFKSEKQKKWMYANKPALARQWQKEYYNTGGRVIPGKNYTDTGKPLDVGQGSIDRDPITGLPRKRVGTNPKTVASAIIDFIPVIGDIKALGEAGVAAYNKQYITAGLLAGAAVIGLVPGVGDAIAAPIKKAAKLSANIFKKLIQGLNKTLPSNAISGLGNEISSSAGRIAIRIATYPTADEAQLIRKEIDRLTEIAKNEGYTVREDALRYKGPDEGGPATYFKSHPDKTDGLIRIPPLDTRADYVVALEEFEHAINSGLTGNQYGRYGTKFLEEARAKTQAALKASKDLNITKEELRSAVGDGFSAYLVEIYNDIANTGTTKYHLPGLNHDIWELANIPPINLNNIINDPKELNKLGKTLETRIGPLNEIVTQGTKAGANATKQRKIAVKQPDGTSFEEYGELTVDQIANLTGKKVKTVRNALNEGRIIKAPNGMQFKQVKEGEEIASIKTPDDSRTKIRRLVNKDGDFVYEGTITDYLRGEGYTPGTSEFDSARAKLDRGVGLDGVHTEDVGALKAKLGKNYNPEDLAKLQRWKKWDVYFNPNKDKGKAKIRNMLTRDLGEGTISPENKVKLDQLNKYFDEELPALAKKGVELTKDWDSEDYARWIPLVRKAAYGNYRDIENFLIAKGIDLEDAPAIFTRTKREQDVLDYSNKRQLDIGQSRLEALKEGKSKYGLKLGGYR